MTLAEFLLARIAEDEAEAGRLHDYSCPDLNMLQFYGWRKEDGLPTCCEVPARVLAECEAQRRIVRQFYVWDDQAIGTGLEIAIQALATVYADHPDYRYEWRP